MTHPPDSPGDPQSGGDSLRARRLLALGAGLGLVLAAVGLLRAPEASDLPPDAIARVDDALIRKDDYLRLLSGYESDTRGESDAEAKRHILDRMIDEELLVQRALALGLGHLDRKVRGDLTSSLINAIVSEVEDAEPEPGELEAFYAEHEQYFTRPGRVRARQIHFRERAGRPAPAERAREARQRLDAGEDWNAVSLALGDPEISPLPDSLLPILKVREYLGPTVAFALNDLEVGEWSEAIRSGTGLHIVQLMEREPASVPDFAGIRAQVETEWRRRKGDDALRAYLDELREDAEVVIDADFEAAMAGSDDAG